MRSTLLAIVLLSLALIGGGLALYRHFGGDLNALIRFESSSMLLHKLEEARLQLARQLGVPGARRSMDRELGSCRAFRQPVADGHVSVILSEVQAANSSRVELNELVRTMGLSILCKWPASEGSIQFNTDEKTELRIGKHQDEPPELTLKAGSTVVTSRALDFKIASSNHLVRMRSVAPAFVRISWQQSHLSVLVISGKVTVTAEPVIEPNHDGPLAVLTRSPRGEVLIDGKGLPLDTEALILPSGLELKSMPVLPNASSGGNSRPVPVQPQFPPGDNAPPKVPPQVPPK